MVVIVGIFYLRVVGIIASFIIIVIVVGFCNSPFECVVCVYLVFLGGKLNDLMIIFNCLVVFFSLENYIILINGFKKNKC